LMDGDDFGTAFVRNNQTFVQRQCTCTASAFGRATTTSVINQNSSHHLRRDREKMRAVLPMHVTLVDQAKKGFIYKSRCLWRITGRFPLDESPSQPVKFFVNNWN